MKTRLFLGSVVIMIDRLSQKDNDHGRAVESILELYFEVDRDLHTSARSRLINDLLLLIVL